MFSSIRLARHCHWPISLVAGAIFTVALMLSPRSDAATSWNWSVMETGLSSGFSGKNNLAVYNSTFAVAVSSDQTVLRYDGTQWTAFPGAADAFAAYSDWGWPQGGVSISSPDRLFIANYGSASDANTRRLFRWRTEDEWTTNVRPTGSNVRLVSVWAQPGGNNVLAGTLSGIYYSTSGGGGTGGTGWTLVSDNTVVASQIRSISASSVFALDIAGQKIHYSSDGGASFSSQINTPAGLNAFAPVSASSLWAVGNAGTIWHWDGSNFTLYSTPTMENLLNLFAFSEENVWAVGMNNTLLHFDGTSWTQHLTGIEGAYHFYNIAGDELGNLFIAGNNGLILHGIAVPEPAGVATLVIGFALVLWNRRSAFY